MYNIIHWHYICLSFISTVFIHLHMLLPVKIQCRSCLSSSIPSSFLTVCLRSASATVTCHALPCSHIQRLTFIISVQLEVASPRAGIGNSSFAVAKSMGQGGARRACCFHPQSTASLAHDPAVIRKPCYETCYVLYNVHDPVIQHVIKACYTTFYVTDACNVLCNRNVIM
jgi:hypothetical protein